MSDPVEESFEARRNAVYERLAAEENAKLAAQREAEDARANPVDPTVPAPKTIDSLTRGVGDWLKRAAQKTANVPPAGGIDPGVTKALAKDVADLATNVAGGVIDAPGDALAAVTNKATAGMVDTVGVLARALGHQQTSGFGGPGAEMKPGDDLGVQAPKSGIGDPESAAYQLANGVTRFMAVNGAALGVLGGGQAIGFMGHMAAGAFADVMAFENKEGTLSDVLRAVGLDNQYTQYLSGQLSENEWEASAKAALEGAALGALVPVYRAVRAGLIRWPEYAPLLAERLGPIAVAPGASIAEAKPEATAEPESPGKKKAKPARKGSE